jgi:hypothetical protein
MKSKIEHKLQAAVVRLLKPLVRILLRNGIPFGVFEELARWTYVDVAFQESSLPGRKLTDSRVSIITGLSRKEVSRLKEIEAPEDNEAAPRYNRAARVISGWTRDPRFLDMNGQPAKLSLQDGERSFGDLVKAHGGDVPSRAVFDELLRVGSIAATEDGYIELVQRAYVPNTGLSEKIEILGTDVSDLINTIDHNIESDKDPKWFQRKVAYDNIPEEAAATFQVESAEQAQKLLEEFDRFLAAQDRDLNPKKGGSGRKRVGIGIYYFEEDIEKGGESS